MAAIGPRVLDQMAGAYYGAYHTVLDNAERMAMAAWLGFDSYNGDDEDEWFAIFWLIISGAADAIAALVGGYISAQLNYLGVAQALSTPDVSGLLSNQYDSYALSPMIRARYLVSLGIDPADAIQGALPRTNLLVNSALRVAEQEARYEAMQQASAQGVYFYTDQRPGFPTVVPRSDADALATVDSLEAQGFRMAAKRRGELKWKRETTPGACGWCTVMASRLLSEASRQEDSGWHTNCHCEWRMVSTTEAKEWVDPYADGSWKAIIDRRSTPQEVAVNA